MSLCNTFDSKLQYWIFFLKKLIYSDAPESTDLTKLIQQRLIFYTWLTGFTYNVLLGETM